VSLIDHFRRQFTYNDWANCETLAAMQRHAPDERSLALMAHIGSAERLWMERMKQEPQSLPVWPKADLDSCRQQVAEIGRLWREYLNRMGEADLQRPVSYKNSKGEKFTSAIGDILNHVILHSAYHRGQIASHMREAGQTPAYTDFIHAVRQELLQKPA
jgi:uncharacterized damage-inducible protein DinB